LPWPFTIIEKTLQDLSMALLQFGPGVVGPEAAFLDSAVNDLAGTFARRAVLPGEPGNPFGHVPGAALRAVQRVVVGRPAFKQLPREAVRRNKAYLDDVPLPPAFSSSDAAFPGLMEHALHQSK